MGLFHAYDIRGVFGKKETELTVDFAYKLGFAIVSYSKAKEIYVGQDARSHSKVLCDSLVRGITDAGSDVVDVGMCSTPFLYFVCGEAKAQFGTMVTASHNTKEYNGFKMFDKGPRMLYDDAGIKEIEKIFKEQKIKAVVKKGKVTKKEFFTEYVLHHNKFFHVPDNKQLKIVIDAGNGVGYLVAKQFFKDKKNISIVEMYTEPDGDFPNHEANPVKFDTLKELKERVKKEKAQMGIGYDGDADRVIFVDELGEIILPDQTGAILAEYEMTQILNYEKSVQKKKENKTLYIDLRFSKAVDTYLKEKGLNVERVRVGNPFYKEILSKKGGLLAAEMSGHIMYPENYNADDALFATIKMLNILATGKKFSILKKPLEKFYQTDEINYKIPNADEAIRAIEKEFDDCFLTHMDGVTVESEDGWWFNIRKSNTEPLVRLRIEGKNKKEVDSVLNRVKKTIGV